MEPVISSSIALGGTRKRRRAPSSKPSARPSARPRKAAVATSTPDANEVVLPPSLASAAPVVTVTSAPGANKRPQLKYDPSIPMTKDETSAWRREQRRERNRASAAACRTRQRNRIAELEKELGGWKAKFEEALGRLRGMDAGAASEVEEAIVLQDSKEAAKAEDGGFRPDAVVSSAPVVTVKQERCTTPPVVASMDVQQQVTPSPRFVPPITTSAEQDEDVVLSFPIVVDPSSECDALMQAIDHQVKGSEVNHRQVDVNHQVVRGRRGVNVVGEHQGAERHLSILSRPAVKITGAPARDATNDQDSSYAMTETPATEDDAPLFSIESVCDDLLEVVPDHCLSLTERKTMPFPDADIVLLNKTAADVSGSEDSCGDDEPPSSVNDEDSDLGEFLDTVQWL